MSVTVVWFTSIVWFEAGFSLSCSLPFSFSFAGLIILASSAVEKLCSFQNVTETVPFMGFHTVHPRIYCYLTIYYKNHPRSSELFQKNYLLIRK